MADRKVELDLEKELELLERELEENEKIFNQVKDHYDRVLNSRSQGSLKFISDQTSNVLNIRNNRITIIKEMVNIKKLKADTELKEMNINKDMGDNENNVIEMAKQIYELMKTDKREGAISNLLNENNDLNNKTNEIDKEKNKNEEMLKNRMIEINKKKAEEKRQKEINQNGYVLACDLNGNVYAINAEGTKILEDITVPNFEITYTIDELTGLTIATNQFGEEILIIEIAS